MVAEAGAHAFAVELFDDLGAIRSRRMMGGLALYARGRIFAIVTRDDRIFIKANDGLAEAMRAEGSEQFSYERAGDKIVRVGYWTLPETALDDPSEACAWARRSLAASNPDLS